MSPDPSSPPPPAPRRSRGWAIALGPALAAAAYAARPGDDAAVAGMAAVAAWMAAWWITEAVPIAATSLLPLVLVPLLGIEPMADVAVNYGHPTVFLFLGGFLIALGLQVSRAHLRLALAIVSAVGSRPRRVVLGFMLGCWLLSMWISNTATAMLMLPIALSVLAAAREEGAPAATLRPFGIALMLGIAYACNMGGMATLVGTPPNLVFRTQFPLHFPGAPEVTFLQWMLVALPMSTAFVACGWWLLVAVLFRLPEGELLGGRAAVAGMRAQLGPRRRDETLAAAVFLATAALWLTGSSLGLGDATIPGWKALLGLEGVVDDAMIAVAMALVLFLLPSRDRPGERLLEWRFTTEVPWGLLLLFGGGFALASGFETSGLSGWAGERLARLAGVSPLLLVVIVCASVTLLTEVTSNTATTQIVLPALAAVSLTVGVDPRALMIPATLSASCAFMMPVATPPAAIVFGSGWVPIRAMIRAGIVFNAVGLLLVIGTTWLLGLGVLDLQLDGLPAWAAP